MFTEFDRLAMTRALALAERGLETTHPNPRVGCVLAKGDRIIGEGWHERAGEPHAEIMALRSAKEPVAGATAYVTLEPCSHHGRTPPCANALIEARIARVVFAVQDPNPRVSGQGADALLRAGITVEAGLMQNEATELNIGFMKRMKEGLPWVRVKLAMSLDGRTALANGASQWITGEPARADVQRWRARCSAVMTGVGTVLADDPQLNVRLPGFKGRQPLRVVLDARLRSPPGAKMFGSLGGAGAAGAVKAGGFAAVGGAVGSVAGQASTAAIAGAVATGAARVGVANAAAGLAAGAVVVGGSVVIFAAADGGFATNSGVGRRAVISDPSTLSGDMAELVNAFETSPTAVSARTDGVAGPVSVKAGPRASSPVQASASSEALPVADAGAVSASAVPVATATEAASVSPPVLAAAGDAAGVAPTSDDATWAGAALSGAVPVRREGETASTVVPSGQIAPPVLANEQIRPAPLAQAAAPGTGQAKSLAETAAQGRGAASAPHAAGAPIAQAGLPTGAVAPNRAASVPPDTGRPTAAGAPTAVAGSPSAVGAPIAAAGLPTGAAASVAAGTSTAAAALSAAAAPTGAAAKADSPTAFGARKAALAGKGVRIEEVPADHGFLDLFAVLKKLGEMEVNEVLVEAGPTLAGQLLTTFLVDELLLYVAPKLLGPQGRPLVNLPELQSLQDAWGFSLFDAKRFGDDLRLRMRPK